jgi:hypothetical protein
MPLVPSQAVEAKHDMRAGTATLLPCRRRSATAATRTGETCRSTPYGTCDYCGSPTYGGQSALRQRSLSWAIRGLADGGSSTRKLHKRLHTHCTIDDVQVDLNAKPRRAALLQSPLTDSNRRPPPYHEHEEGVDSCGTARCCTGLGPSQVAASRRVLQGRATLVRPGRDMSSSGSLDGWGGFGCGWFAARVGGPEGDQGSGDEEDAAGDECAAEAGGEGVRLAGVGA